jgi:hypothetical protein
MSQSHPWIASDANAGTMSPSESDVCTERWASTTTASFPCAGLRCGARSQQFHRHVKGSLGRNGFLNVVFCRPDRLRRRQTRTGKARTLSRNTGEGCAMSKRAAFVGVGTWESYVASQLRPS